MYLNATLSTIKSDQKLLFSPEIISLLFLSTIAIVGNLFNLIVIYKSPLLRSLDNILLIALLITGFSTGLILIPLILLVKLTGNHVLCQIQGFAITLLNCCSLTLTVALSVDRCHAVINPFSYLRQSNKAKYTIIILSIILFSSMISIFPILGLERFGLGKYILGSICWCSLVIDQTNVIILTFLVSAMIIHILIIIFCYIILFAIAYQKGHQDLSGSFGIKTPLRTVILIVGMNMICWIPMIVVLLHGIFQYNHGSTNATLPYWRIAANISFFLLDAYIAVNPIIYLTTNSILRKKWIYLMNLLLCNGRLASSRSLQLPQRRSYKV
ncbi:Beta-4C adrenergic receptor [Trichoplax sp. H2]|nr:Beta-4C adrenergic receptor [Trichoplax sp. H2]|eukprot:RDD37062.1 Beta-4C adrenergic receptor [Trichoplax sp. H2]